MVPLWATILVGLAGGLIGTLLTIGHERGAEVRTRMIAAADDFLVMMMRFATATRSLRIALDDPQRPTAEIEQARTSLQEIDDRLTELLGRLQLLFGPTSETARGASAIDRALEQLRLEFEAWEANGPVARERVMSAYDVVGELVLQFTSAARRDLRFGALGGLIGR